MLLISDEPGIGKSRLAREIIAITEASNAKILTGQCHTEDSAPYAPIAQIVRSALTNHSNLQISNL